MSPNNEELPAEADAFLASVGELHPNQLTGSTGWTIHELVAHCAAGPAERARVIEAALAGDPTPPTRGFAEREAPYRAMAHDALLESLGSELRRFAAANGQLATAADPSVTFTGWRLTSEELMVHGRSELALHLWDAVGSSPEATAFLGQPDLTVHAVKVFAALPQLAESPTQRSERAGIKTSQLTLRLAAEGSLDDVVVRIDPKHTDVELVTADPDQPALRSTAAGRLLMLWGRQPGPAEQGLSTLPTDHLSALARWIYA